MKLRTLKILLVVLILSIIFLYDASTGNAENKVKFLIGFEKVEFSIGKKKLNCEYQGQAQKNNNYYHECTIDTSAGTYPEPGFVYARTLPGEITPSWHGMRTYNSINMLNKGEEETIEFEMNPDLDSLGICKMYTAKQSSKGTLGVEISFADLVRWIPLQSETISLKMIPFYKGNSEFVALTINSPYSANLSDNQVTSILNCFPRNDLENENWFSKCRMGRVGRGAESAGYNQLSFIQDLGNFEIKNNGTKSGSIAFNIADQKSPTEIAYLYLCYESEKPIIDRVSWDETGKILQIEREPKSSSKENLLCAMLKTGKLSCVKPLNRESEERDGYQLENKDLFYEDYNGDYNLKQIRNSIEFEKKLKSSNGEVERKDIEENEVALSFNVPPCL